MGQESRGGLAGSFGSESLKGCSRLRVQPGEDLCRLTLVVLAGCRPSWPVGPRPPFLAGGWPANSCRPGLPRFLVTQLLHGAAHNMAAGITRASKWEGRRVPARQKPVLHNLISEMTLPVVTAAEFCSLEVTRSSPHTGVGITPGCR